jgi:putative salt-induced outer membrane protein YdiY
MNIVFKSVKYPTCNANQSSFGDIMRYGTYAIIFLTLAAGSLSADDLVLKNGDIIQGSLIEQSSEQIIWASENFGDLNIAIDKISALNGAAIASTDNGPKPQPVFSSTYNGDVSATGAYASGNEEREDWDIEGSVEWREGDFRHHSGINYESHSLDGSPANEEYHLNYGVDWFFQEQWFWNNGASWGANDNRAIDQYYALGSAIGRQFWDKESGALSAETGLLWISEEYEDSTTDDRLTWSWAADYRQMITSSLELFHTHSLRVSISDLDDSELRADLGLKAPLIRDIFTELKLEWIYDNQPVEGTDPSDSQLTIGVSYSW